MFPSMSIPPLSSLNQMLFDSEECIAFLMNKMILEVNPPCEICSGPSIRRKTVFQCKKKSCRKRKSIFRNTFFAHSRLKCNEVMMLGYLWLSDSSGTTVLHQTGRSKPTICAYRKYFRQLVASTIESDDTMIGGEGITVEIDETKMGKRKFHRGHHVDGAWVLVGVERTIERRVFAEVVKNRSEAVICEVLSRHLVVGSRIHTDCWKGYANLQTIYNVEHLTVNHSIGFKDSATGVHTNTVEGTNYALKRRVPPRNRTEDDLPLFLTEFVWWRKNHSTLWDSLLDALRDVVYDN